MYSCSTCNSATTCTTCNSTALRILNAASLCICSNNYYDDGSNELCLPCSYACLTCVTTSTKCLTCDTTLRLFQLNWCACPQYFYDNNSTVACVACNYTCSTCLKGTACHTCNASNFRIFDSINQYCVCMQGYYDDGSN
jgi:proprotein convertase subtilisin/kexin type 5